MTESDPVSVCMLQIIAYDKNLENGCKSFNKLQKYRSGDEHQITVETQT